MLTPSCMTYSRMTARQGLSHSESHMMTFRTGRSCAPPGIAISSAVPLSHTSSPISVKNMKLWYSLWETHVISCRSVVPSSKNLRNRDRTCLEGITPSCCPQPVPMQGLGDFPGERDLLAITRVVSLTCTHPGMGIAR